ncbi:helix-turn-helix domain-containing protein [Haloarcula sp. S1CR25-12]|uniref:Helix-turn-helix domain-containing protein n=1 Tax=Haloarcula saliterrae TaxID=2950534 RepID=A0ABU2F7S1_9EURY|nr:bacterio-opsin activator domain-containing protein [Haloarcula sp. S1CR25-12]MDS0257796.1 helix-turn-helix domain-containing protein [Haloarcula sp. S1CR25-12]
MEHPSEERRVNRAADVSAVPLTLLTLLIPRLAEPAAVLDESATVVAANEALSTLAGGDGELVDESLTAVFPALTGDAIERNIERPGEYVTVRTGDEPERWVEFGFDRHGAYVLCVGHDVTGYRAKEHRLEEHERVLDTIHDAVYTLDHEATIRSVNGAVETLTGYDAEELVGADVSLLVDEATVERGQELTRALRDGERDVATLSSELTTADGETVPIETQFATAPRENGPDRHVGVVRDIADRQAFAETLASVQRATRELLYAETSEAVAEHIVGTATEVLSLSGATLYLFDARRNVLWPAGAAGVAGTDERQALCGEDEGVVRDVFLEGTERSVDSGDRYQPLGDHGVFHTVAAEPDDRTHELVELLARSARAALERVGREATLREREATHRRQAERVAELERVLAVLRRTTRSLVDADSVEAVEQGVCAALTESDWVSFAWIGRVDADGVDPRTWAGRGSNYLEAVSLSTADPDGPPAVRTARSNELTTVDAIAEDIREQRWRTAAIARDFQAVISVPLRVDGVSYGVLSVYANRPVEFREPLTSVFADLGDSVANAVREHELRTRYASDSAVELSLTIAVPDSPLGRLAAVLDTTVHGEAVIPVDGTATRLFLHVPDTDAETVADAVTTVQHVDSVVTVADDDRYELLAREPTVVGRLMRHGARLGEVRVADDEMELTVVLAAETDVRTFIDQTAEFCEGVQLTARRERPSPTHRGGVRDSLEAQLTDRQLEVLRTAYSSGFFEWPRTTTGEGVAEMLDVSQPTVNRHLRVSQRKLLELVFDD